MATEKTFYLETFGCQMNAHDSEKVIGTLQQQGYRQVLAEEDAGLILYNTCSIRDKAEQKVFHRLDEYEVPARSGSNCDWAQKPSKPTASTFGKSSGLRAGRR